MAKRSGATAEWLARQQKVWVKDTAPTATLSTTASSPTSTAPIPFAVSFFEPVTGLIAGSFTVTNGTVTNGTNAYTFSVMPTSNGRALL